MLKFEQVSVLFNQVKVLDNLTLDFQQGEIIGLVAPNGTGKSTLLNASMNYVPLTTGEVIIKDNYRYDSIKSQSRIYELISLLPNQNDLYNYLSGYDHLKIYEKMWSKTAINVDEVVASLNMTGYVKRPVRTYSLGMRQRLCFAMQMVANTEIMLMDELMNGLDPDNVELISGVLVKKKEAGKCLIIASHLLENLQEYADRVLFLKAGKVIFEYTSENEAEKKLKFNHQQAQALIPELLQESVTLANGTTFLELNEWTSLQIQQKLGTLLQAGLTEFEVGPLQLRDYYAMYYS